jgi:hypothetical protein
VAIKPLDDPGAPSVGVRCLLARPREVNRIKNG